MRGVRRRASTVGKWGSLLVGLGAGLVFRVRSWEQRLDKAPEETSREPLADELGFDLQFQEKYGPPGHRTHSMRLAHDIPGPGPELEVLIGCKAPSSRR